MVRINKRKLLLEMPVVSENEVFAQSPVASVSTESTFNLEGEKLRAFVMGIISQTSIPQNYVLTERELGTIISHHCTGKPLKKAALQTIPEVLKSNNVISPWKRKEGKGIQSGLVAAPIIINGEKYLCCVTLHKNLQKKVTPYAITLKDANGDIVNEEKAISAIKVPDSTDGSSSFGNTRLSMDTASLDANTPSDANIQNKTNESKSNKNMKKNIVKINENTLRQIVAESVKKVLKEEGEGVEMMGSVPSESYGKYGNLMERLDEEGDKAIEHLLQKNGMLDGRDFSTKQFSAEQVYGMLSSLKSSLIHALDTRYW